MYYIGLNVIRKRSATASKMRVARSHQEGKIGATRCELDSWMKTLPQPWTVAMEATIFTGWIYDHLLPHAQQVKGSASADAARHRCGIDPIVLLLGRSDGAQHQRMRYLHLLRVWK